MDLEDTGTPALPPIDDARPYLRHLAELNRHDPARYVPWYIGSTLAGLMRRDFIDVLLPYRDVFSIAENRIELTAGNNHAQRSENIAGVVGALAGQGLFALRNEPYRIVGAWGEPSLAAIDRGACTFFGTRAFGVHVNGFVRRHDQYQMWIARRAQDRAVSPGKLDHLIAGGVSEDLTAQQTLFKEAYEEAGVTLDQVTRAVPCGFVSYAQDKRGGLEAGSLFVYDLETEPDFLPCNDDGEVESFELMPLEKVASIVATTDDFKPNCNLVLIDFLIRHGMIEPDAIGYEALVTGLRGFL